MHPILIIVLLKLVHLSIACPLSLEVECTQQLPGYTTWSEVVEVHNGAISYVSASLSPSAPATQSPAPMIAIFGVLGACAVIFAARRQE